MATLRELEKEIRQINERNRRVEVDKVWETSIMRRVLLVGFTYLAVGFYLSVIAVPNPWVDAIVPSVAFMLSTLTLPFFKKLWLKHAYKK